MKPLPLPCSAPRQRSRPLFRRLRLAVLPALGLFVFGAAAGLRAQVHVVASPAPSAPEAGTPAAAAPKGNLVAVIKAAGKYATFLKVLDAAGLTATLEQAGPYTVFAPTDEAFSKLPAGALDRLMKPESKAKLTALLNYHIAPGKFALPALAKMDELKTLNGEEIDVDTATDGKTIEMDDAKIVTPDLEAANGVVHGIDGVLEP
jgi:uncharacterized surface protein with fasciclin (FAS1) repeats